MGAWQNFSENYVRKATEVVVDTVVDYANRGYSRQIAIEQAALSLGMTPRRVKALWYEPDTVSVRRAEFERLKQMYTAHLEAKADELAQRSREARERARVLKTQNELGV